MLVTSLLSKMDEKSFLKSKGFRTRVTMSMAIWAAWLCFLILYLFVFNLGHDIWQMLGVIVVSIIVCGVLTAIMWAGWGMKYAAEHADEIEECVKKHMDDEIKKYIDEEIERKLSEKKKK